MIGKRGFELNRRSYDAIATQWAQTRVRLSAAEQGMLELLVRDLAPRSRVLDLGCGTGVPVATLLLERGLAVTGIDQSAQMLAIARQQHPQAEWILGAIESFEPTDLFSAVVAWDSLFHLPRAEHAPIFRNVRQATVAGGRFALTVGGSEHPEFTDLMFGREFFYDSHPPDVVLTLLREVGFSIIHSEFLNQPTSGRDKGRFAIVAEAG